MIDLEFFLNIGMIFVFFYIWGIDLELKLFLNIFVKFLIIVVFDSGIIVLEILLRLVVLFVLIFFRFFVMLFIFSFNVE